LDSIKRLEIEINLLDVLYQGVDGESMKGVPAGNYRMMSHLESRVFLIESGAWVRYDRVGRITPMLADREGASHIMEYCCRPVRDKKERSLDSPGAVNKRATRADLFSSIRNVFWLSICISIILFLYGYAKIYLLLSGPFRKNAINV
jgi:hypothetical protein